MPGPLVKNSRHLKHENLLQTHFKAVLLTVYLLKRSCRIGYAFEWLKYSPSTLEKMRSVFTPVQPEGFGIVRRLEMDGEKKKKTIYGWNEVKCRLRIGKEKKKRKNVKNCCMAAWWKWRHLCGFRGIYRHGSSAEPERAAAKFESRKSRIHATSHTPDPLLISYPRLPPPSPRSQCGTYICSASSLTERKCNRSKQISFRLLKWKWVLLFEWKRNAFFSSQIALSVTCRALVCLP